MTKTVYGVVDESIEALQKLQLLKIPFGSTLDISDLVVYLEDKYGKVYMKTLSAINEKYTPRDEDGNIVYADKDKTRYQPTDPTARLDEINKLNNTEIEVPFDKIVIEVTPELEKQDFVSKWVTDLQWIVTFKRQKPKK